MVDVAVICKGKARGDSTEEGEEEVREGRGGGVYIRDFHQKTGG